MSRSVIESHFNTNSLTARKRSEYVIGALVNARNPVTRFSTQSTAQSETHIQALWLFRFSPQNRFRDSVAGQRNSAGTRAEARVTQCGYLIPISYRASTFTVILESVAGSFATPYRVVQPCRLWLFKCLINKLLKFQEEI